MARSRLFEGFLLFTCMFILLLICLYNAKPAMGYDLLLVAVFYISHSNVQFNSIVGLNFLSGLGSVP